MVKMDFFLIERNLYKQGGILTKDYWMLMDALQSQLTIF